MTNRLLICFLLVLPTVAYGEPVSFKRDVAPILLDQCLACHGPKKAEGGYRIDTFERAVAAGDSTQPGFLAGKLEESEAFRRIVSTDKAERMPLEGDPLPEEQVATLKRWLEEGAAFDGPDPKASLASYIPPPTHPAAPEAYTAALPITAVQFSPDGQSLAVAGYHEVLLYNPADGALLRRLANVGQRTYAIRYSPDGQLLAVACGTPGKLGEVRVFKPDTGELIRVLATTSDVVFDCAFSPAGDRLATAAADGTVRLFNVADGAEQRTITSHSDWVFAVAWKADGSQLATGSRDKTAKVFDAQTGELLITFSGHNSPVRGVLFHPDGAEVYSAGTDNKIQRWKIADAAKTKEVGLGGEVYKLALGGESLIAPAADNKVREFKAKELDQIRELAGPTDWVLAADLHPATKRIAAGSFDGRVFVWNAEDGAVITSFLAAPGLAAPQ
jgi:WD40 repeat protein